MQHKLKRCTILKMGKEWTAMYLLSKSNLVIPQFLHHKTTLWEFIFFKVSLSSSIGCHGQFLKIEMFAGWNFSISYYSLFWTLN